MTTVSKKGRVNKQSNVRRFKCGCKITMGKVTGAFEIAPCNYHVGRLNTTSLSLSEIVKKIQGDQN